MYVINVGTAASNGNSNANDVYLINADCVDKISVDDKSPAESLKPIDFQKVKLRCNAVSLILIKKPVLASAMFLNLRHIL